MFRLYDYNNKTGHITWWDKYPTFDRAQKMCKVWFTDAPSDYLVYDTEDEQWFVYHPSTELLVAV